MTWDVGGANQAIFDEQYAKWIREPMSVDRSWRELFTSLDKEEVEREEPFPSVIYQTKREVIQYPDVRVYNLIQAYRTFGHLLAKVNPLSEEVPRDPPELQLETHGLNKQDLSALFPTFGILPEEKAPLIKTIQALKAIYCDKIGYEYMFIRNPELKSWLQRRIEPETKESHLSIEQKQLILQQLDKSELLESFIHTKYVGQKRFSLEGAETLIPMLSAVLEAGSQKGVEEAVIGMAHRGRLNVLANILNKSYKEVFSEFVESYIPESFEGSGDVKYHKGFSAELKMAQSKKLKVDLSPNPSHLESVDPVVEGMVRAKQTLLDDEERREKVLPILIHGDAALTGQGVVYETLQMYQLKGYTTGGTLHLVINNQIGFTTFPEDGRSTPYCTDIAKAFEAPVFHVNAEDPEGCVYATNLALEIRQKFHCDVFVDLVCYRKYGHNETDEPAFTQPLEYQIIRKKRPIRDLYREALIQQGVLEKYMAESLETEFKKGLNLALKSVQKVESKEVVEKEAPLFPPDQFKPFPTGVDREILEEIATKVSDVPEGFNIHPKIANLFKERFAMVKEGSGGAKIDWGMGETLAYGTLLLEGVPIRISGQDSCRGTFSHRQALWMDTMKEQGYIPLQHLSPSQARFQIYNSLLSEGAVLGFEYGYSTVDPKSLVIWEAQFGDFANGAQVTIDQFIATSEQKWGQKAGLVLFLPHGYEGQGPEHSSARIERFLQLCGHDNLCVVHPTTPAQLFHVLRRQKLKSIEKPLILFTPKGLLRHPECVSHLTDLTEGGFQEILDDPLQPKNVAKLVFCSGRIYYDIAGMRAKAQVKDMALIRVEQLYPLDEERIKEILEQYAGFQECIWVQEEPANMGAWSALAPQLAKLMPKGKELQYLGRARSAATATGIHTVHKRELASIMGALFAKYQLRVPHDEMGIKT